MAEPPTLEHVADRIRLIRGQRVMLDFDVAKLYSVTTSRLNQQVKRNPARFPADFMFQLTPSACAELNLLQNVTGSQRHRDPRLRPRAFTEHGCLMLSNVLKSPRAVDVSVLIVRAFVRLRAAVVASQHLAQREIRRLTQFPEKTSRGIGFTADID